MFREALVNCNVKPYCLHRRLDMVIHERGQLLGRHASNQVLFRHFRLHATVIFTPLSSLLSRHIHQPRPVSAEPILWHREAGIVMFKMVMWSCHRDVQDSHRTFVHGGPSSGHSEQANG